MLRENESGLFLSLCRSFIEVAFPHCATCFGRCYPGGAVMIMESKNLYEGVGRLLSISSSREVPKSVGDDKNAEEKKVSENGDTTVLEDGVKSVSKEAEDVETEEKEENGSSLQKHTSI